MTTNKKLIIVFSAVFILFLTAAFILNSIRPAESAVIISVDGKQVKEVDLSKDDTFSLKTEFGTNEISVKGNTICIKDATCPDKLCVRHGKLRNKYDAIVCLPNKVVIEYKDKSEYDAVAGR